MHLFARSISYLFHPILMPVLGLVVMYFTNEEVSNQTIPQYYTSFLYMMLAVSAVIVLTALIMRSQGVINSLEVVTKRERIMLFGLALIWYMMLYVMVTRKEFVVVGMHPSIFSAMFGALISIGLMLIITPFFKISAHMTGIAGVGGIMAGLSTYTLSTNMYIIAAIIVACGIVGTARMILNAHTLKEIVAGFFLGFICTYFTVSNSWMVTF